MAKRGNFSSKIGFVAAAAGSAVGLGNIWKFPFEVGKGGGAAFLVMYLIFCFIFCFPVLVTELAIGRKTGKNPDGAFKSLGFRNWSFVGKLGVITGVLILSFYNVVAGWAFGYFVEIVCGNFEIGGQFTDFIKDVVKVGGYGLIFMAATALIVSRGVSSGIERAAKILMPVLIIIIVSLIVYSLTLPNAMKGIEFYLIPNFSAITPEVVYTALSHAFFSLSLGMGALITYGSYVSKSENLITSAALITLADIGIAFIAGLMMFPFVFSQGIAPDGGAGLIFITLPGVFESLGSVTGVIVGGLFFLLLSFAALTSTVSLLEVPVSYTVDEHNIPRKKATWLVALVIYIIGIPSLLSNGASGFFSSFISYFGSDAPKSFMTVVEDFSINTFLPLGGLLMSIFVAYVWKKENLNKELETGAPNFKGSFVEKYIDVAIRYICPIFLGALFILTVLEKFFSVSIF